MCSWVPGGGSETGETLPQHVPRNAGEPPLLGSMELGLYSLEGAALAGRHCSVDGSYSGKSLTVDGSWSREEGMSISL